MLHRPIHLSSVFLLLQRLSLVVFLFASTQCYVHLSTSVLVDEYESRHNGVSRLLCSVLKLVYFALVEQQLAVASCFMVAERAVEVGRDVHALHPHLMVGYIAESVDKTRLSESYRLYLGAGKHYACRIRLHKKVLKRGFLVLYAHRTFLSLQFLFLIHCFCY